MGGYADNMHLTQKISVIHDSVCLTQGVILALHLLGNTFLLLYLLTRLRILSKFVISSSLCGLMIICLLINLLRILLFYIQIQHCPYSYY